MFVNKTISQLYDCFTEKYDQTVLKLSHWLLYLLKYQSNKNFFLMRINDYLHLN